MDTLGGKEEHRRTDSPWSHVRGLALIVGELQVRGIAVLREVRTCLRGCSPADLGNNRAGELAQP